MKNTASSSHRKIAFLLRATRSRIRQTCCVLAFASALALSLGQSALAATYTWTLSATGNWSSTSGTTDWKSATYPTLAGDVVLYNPTNAANTGGTVTLDTNATVGTVRIMGSSNTAAFTIAKSGTFTLTIDNTGGGTNGYGTTGGLLYANANVNTNDQLVVNPDIIIANTDLDVVAGNSGLKLGASVNASSITASTSQNLNFRVGSNRAINVNDSIGTSGAGTISISNIGSGGVGAQSTNLNGDIGAMVGSITQNSANSALVLAGSNTNFTGTTMVNAGTLRYASANAMPGGVGRSITVNSGGIASAGYAIDQAFLDRIVLSSSGVIALNAASANNLDFTGFTDASLGATAAVTLSGTLTPNAQMYRVGGGTATLTISSNLIDNASTTSLTKVGTDAVILSGSNGYSGTTTINQGTLVFNAATAIAGSGRNVTVNSNTVASAGYAINQAFLDRINQSSAGAIALNVASANNLDFTGFGSASLGATAAVTLSGTLTPDAQMYRLGGGSANLTISTALANNGGTTSLTKSGADTVILGGSNGYSGTTAVNGGTLQIAGNLAAGSGSVSVASGATLAINMAAGDTLANGVVNNGTVSKTAGANTNTMTGSISGTGAVTQNITGGVFILAGSNSYSGATTVSAGTLKAGGATAFNNTSALTLTGSGTLDLAGFNASFTNLTGTATSTITTTGSGAGTDTLTITAFGNDGTGGLFTDNGIRKLALNMTSNGVGAYKATTGTNNTFSGGLILNADMRIKPFAAASTIGSPGAITSGPFGRGTITLNGTTVSHGSQIYFDLSGYTLVNDVIVNSNVGNGGRVGSIRVTGTSGVISGSITANAVDAVIGADTNAAAITLTGQLTGAKGFTFNQSGGTITTNWVTTLNNASANNDYAGVTTINGANTTLKLGAANQIPNGASRGNVALTLGILDLNGYSETINGFSGAGTVDNVVATGSSSNTLTLGDGDATGSFSGKIINTSGTLGLAKIGTGVQTLSGSNNYSGGTVVSLGGLSFANLSAKPSAGTHAFGAAATLGLGVSGSGNYFTSTDIDNAFSGTMTGNLSNVTVTPTTNVGIDTGAGNFDYTSSLPSVTRGLVKLGANTLTLSGSNAYTGPTTITAGTLSVAATENLGAAAANLVFDGGTLQVTGTTLTNFSGIGHAVLFNSGKTVGLDINSAANTFTADQVLDQGTGGLTKSGSGTLTFSGSSANTYTGTTTLTGGVLQLSKTAGVNAIAGNINYTNPSTINLTASNQIADTSVVTFASGNYSYLNMNGYSETVAGIVSNGSGVIQNAQTASTGTSVLIVGDTNNYTFSGFLRNNAGGSGILSLVKQGSGKQTLSGSLIAYTGPTTINAGTLELNGASGFSSAVGFGAGSSGILQVVGTTSKANDLSTADAINNSAFVQNATGADAVLTINQAGNTSFGGVIRDNPTSNKLGITKAGAGTLTLSNSNTYTGATTISAGTLSVAITSNLGAPAANLVFDGGTLQITGTTLTSFSGIGHTVLFNSGKTVGLDINSAANTFTADQSLNQGAGGLTKSGSGMLILPIANTYTGETRINAGTLRVDNASALSGSNSVGWAGNGLTAIFNNNTGTTLNLDKAYFRSNGSGNQSGSITGAAVIFNGLAANATNSDFTGLQANNAGVTFAGGLQLLGDATNRNFTLAGSGPILVSGNVINGAAYPANHGKLSYNGSGSLTLSGSANTYSNGMTLNSGTLNINSTTALGTTAGPTGGLFTIANNTTINNTLGSTVTNANNNPVAVNGNFTFVGSNDLDLGTGAVALGGTTRTITTNAGNLTLGGVISATGTFGITKAGAGSLTLNGTNTYTGMTTVNNGTLNFGVSETLTGGLTVATSGTVVLTAHTGGAANVKVLDITGLTISGTTPFVGDGGKDFGGLASPAPVPEPGTIGLLVVGAIGVAAMSRRHRHGS